MKKRVILEFVVSLLFFLAFCWSYSFPSVGSSIPPRITVSSFHRCWCKKASSAFSQPLRNFQPMGNIIAADYQYSNYTSTWFKTCSGLQPFSTQIISSLIYWFFFLISYWKAAVCLHSEPTWTGPNLNPLEWIWTLWPRAIKLGVPLTRRHSPAPPSPRLHC